VIYTGQLDFVPKYRYQVHVVVKGNLFTKGMEWTGPWVETNGNGPLMLTVPTPEDAGVTVTRDFPLATTAPSPSPTAPGPGPTPIGQPPALPGAPPARTSRGVPQPLTVSGYGAQPAGPSSRDFAPNGASHEEEPLIAGWSSNDPGLKNGKSYAHSR
jgi:hypothetical protein